MRVLLANPYFWPHEGGIEGRLQGLARGLARRHEVGVLTARLPGTALEETRDGYTILRCPARVWRGFPSNPPPLWTRGILARARAWKPDLLDYQYRWAPEWNRAMAAWAREGPLVLTWHNAFGEGEGLVGRLSAWNDRRFVALMGSARGVVCISRAVEQDLARRGVAPGKLRTVHAGFDAPPPLALPEGDHAVFAGRLVATKGLDVLLAALPAAPEVRVVLVGKGPERARLERLAARLGVQDRVRFAGFVREEEKRRLVAGARFVVHPARWESLGHALAEAMLQGKPVIASDVGGIPEVVGPGGVLVPTGDAAALAAAMRDLWADAGLRAALGWKAQAHAATFTWDRCVAATERVYREAVER
ncbi:MAG TPA: glycosyltransferase family 4 protein [Candidatus Thermoplasmatota archaeon]|nr:glycosyltransferase family 4 protein [Candidatus Thermoplasmatota archaeon]